MSEPLPPEALTPVQLEREKATARRKLWRAGKLSWKFQGRPWCKRMYEFIRTCWSLAPFLMMLVHRRAGKSTTGLIICLEECLRNPHTTVAVVCGTKDQAQAICEESFAELLEDCPADVQPRRIKQEYAYVFDHNGSKIVILAADGLNAKRMRGRKFKFVLITEAAFIPRLRKIITGIIAPTLLDVTGAAYGTMVIESTPPDETIERDDAEKFEAMWAEADLDGRGFFLPLSKNGDAAPEFVARCKKDCGGEDTVDYKREYECQFVQEENSSAVPEFTPARAFKGDPEKGELPLVREVPRPSGADRYVSMDVGGRDLTALLFAFYFFEQNLVVIEDELTLLNMTSDDLAVRVKAKEEALWGTDGGKLLRFADNNNVVLLYDLQRMHKLRFLASAKDNKDAQINQLRVMVRDGLIAIHPRCHVLCKTLRLARRHKQASKGFERAEGIGHADLLDALLYLVRNVRRNAMPAPAAPTHSAVRDAVRPPNRKSSSGAALAAAMGLRRR